MISPARLERFAFDVARSFQGRVGRGAESPRYTDLENALQPDRAQWVNP
jgi:hypothetical protein